MSLSLEITNGVYALKEGDTKTDITMRLIEGNGVAYDLTGKTVVVTVANKMGKLFDKTATLGANKGEITFGIDPADVTGNGKIYLEAVVTVAGEKRIFPSDGYVTISVKRNLNALGAVYPTQTIEGFMNQFQSLQAEIDSLVVYGNSPSELAQARIGYDGTVYSTIKRRLDAELLGVSGSPKGVYTTLAQLTSAFPAGNNNTYVVSADGNWYYWNGSAWVAGGVYQATQIAEGTVTPLKTSFIESAKNKFDNSILTAGRVNSVGTFTVDSSNQTAEIEPIDPSTTYVTNASVFINLLDSAKQFISYSFLTAGQTFTTTASTRYIRISTPNANVNTLQVEKGSASTTYESYRKRFKSVDFDDLYYAKSSSVKLTTYPSLNARLEAIETDVANVVPSTPATDAQAEQAFIDEMNKKASRLGCTLAQWVNSSGLSGAGQLTNPRDFGLILRHASGIPDLLKVWGAKSFSVAVKGSNARTVNITTSVANTTFENAYTILGGKTGTLGVVENLAIIAQHKATGYIFGGVILRADSDRWVAMKQLLDEAVLVTNGSPTSAPVITSVGACAFRFPTVDPLLFTNTPLNEIVLKGQTSNQSPASITKILTAMVMIENMDNMNDIIEFKTSDIVEDSLLFAQGDRVTYREALYLMMLQSNNSTAKAVARTVGQQIIKKRRYV